MKKKIPKKKKTKKKKAANPTPSSLIMTIERITEARAQYLYITKGKKHISAARILITSERYSPWLVTHGREYLPENAIKRGIYLTKIFNQA